MKKQVNNSFTGAALSLCMTPEELRSRLDAHLKLEDIKIERDRAIDAATHERERLQRLAKAITESLSKKPIKRSDVDMLLKYAQNIELI